MDAAVRPRGLGTCDGFAPHVPPAVDLEASSVLTPTESARQPERRPQARRQDGQRCVDEVGYAPAIRQDDAALTDPELDGRWDRRKPPSPVGLPPGAPPPSSARAYNWLRRPGSGRS